MGRGAAHFAPACRVGVVTRSPGRDSSTHKESTRCEASFSKPKSRACGSRSCVHRPRRSSTSSPWHRVVPDSSSASRGKAVVEAGAQATETFQQQQQLKSRRASVEVSLAVAEAVVAKEEQCAAVEDIVVEELVVGVEEAEEEEEEEEVEPRWQWSTSRNGKGHADGKCPTEGLLHGIKFTGVSCQEVSNLVRWHILDAHATPPLEPDCSLPHSYPGIP